MQPAVPLCADDVRAVHAAHERFLESGAVPPDVRALVAESWRRSAAAGVDVDAGCAPSPADPAEFTGYREVHPLARVFPLLYNVLGRAAEECDAVMAVGDAHGQLLWVCGRPAVLDRAERINFAVGAAWDEAHAGTNAPGTALRIDAPVQILAAEHFLRSVQPWTCAAAPIHDPVSKAILGIVDITGGVDVATPQTLAMVRAAARMAEAELGRLHAVAPTGITGIAGARLWLPAMGPEVSALGRPDCLVDLNGHALRLSPRHSEILILLVEHPDGLTGDELAIELYREDVSTSTLRAELTRMRSLLGAELLDSRPYRLRRDLSCDWLTVQRALDADRPDEAIAAYRGPLLPHSDAPGVAALRDRLDRHLRAALLTCGEVDLMAAWTRSRWGADDIEIWQRQLTLAPAGSPLHTIADAEVLRLDRELGVR